MDFRSGWLVASCVLLAGCPSEVQVEDGRRPPSDDGGGAGNATGTGGASSTSGSAGSGSVAQQIEQACKGMCLSGCGEKAGCTQACAEDFPTVLPECADEAVSLLECLTKKENTPACPSVSGDCQERASAYWHCQNPLLCGSWGDDLQCTPPAAGCSCTQNCDRGHVAGATCTFDVERDVETCECSFDGVVVGQCENAIDSGCVISSSVCCAPFWR